MFVYLKNAVWDLLLCILASSALAFTLCSGFYSTQVYQTASGTAMVVGICAIVCVALFAVTLNRRIMPFLAVGLTVVLIVGVVVAISTSTSANATEDVVGNNLYLALIVTLVPVGVFLLSRKRLLVMVLLFVGVLLCGAIEYLYWYGHTVAFMLFLVATIGLYAYRAYQVSLINSESESLAFASVSVSSVLFAAGSIAIAFAVAALVIAPLSPPNIVVKLRTDHYRADEIEVKGVGAIDSLPQNDLTTDQQNSDSVQSSDQDENPEGGENPDESNGGGGSIFGRISMLVPPWAPYALVVALVVLLVGSILFKRYRRAKGFSRMRANGNESTVEQLYLFFMKRFERFKIPQPETLTLTEYANGFADTFNRFEQNTDTPEFCELTRVYNDAVFGGHTVSDEERALFEDYYKSFYKRAVHYVGRLRYCRLFFFI